MKIGMITAFLISSLICLTLTSTASDGSFSSPGAFGFYPWIDSTKTYYGIVAREVHNGVLASEEAQRPYLQSMNCGRLIRKAWKTGTAVTDK